MTDTSASPLRGVLQVAFAATLWGMWSLFLRPTGLGGAASAPVVLLVMGVSGLALVRLEGREARWDRHAVGLLMLYGLLDAVNAGAFFAAMQTTTVAVAVLTHCTAPLLIALLAPRVEGTRVPGSVPAALLALSGLTLLLRPWASVDDGVWLGAGLGLASAVAYAALVFVVQPLAARIGVGRATSYHAFVSAALLLPLGARELAEVEPGDVGLLVLGGLLPGGLSAMLFIDGLRRVGSARGAVLTLLEPLVAVGVGAFVWHEPLAPIGVLGAFMVLAAALWVSRAPRSVAGRLRSAPSESVP
jgi:drug/metabolite transporter (DMT)-like permease